MKVCLRFATAVAAVAVLIPFADARADGVVVADAWARATAPTAANGAAYMTLTNTSADDDSVVAAAAGVSETVELHTHIMDGDVMRMREVEAIEVPAGGTTTLEPGGLHIMFIGLIEPLKEGDSFPLTLTFASGEAVEVDVTVAAPGAMHGGAKQAK